VFFPRFPSEMMKIACLARTFFQFAPCILRVCPPAVRCVGLVSGVSRAPPWRVSSLCAGEPGVRCARAQSLSKGVARRIAPLNVP
jgi:hypothetical protein